MSENRPGVRGRTNVVIGATGAATRAGVRLALTASDIDVVAEADSVADLVSTVQRDKPIVCILDKDLSGETFETVAELTARAPSVAVVLLTEDVSEDEFLRAVRAGVAGYLDKGISPEALSKVVRAVAKGEPAIPRSLVVALINGYKQRPARSVSDNPVARGVDLTSREWEVLDYMRDGLSTRQIAGRLLISEVTVRRHISSVLRKLNVATRTDAVNLLQSA